MDAYLTHQVKGMEPIFSFAKTTKDGKTELTPVNKHDYEILHN